MHKLVRAGVAAFVMVSLLAQPVSAAAGGPANAYFGGGAFSFVDRGVEWSGSIQITDDRLNGRQLPSVFFARIGAERTCYPGTPDEYVANDFIEFFGQKYAADINVRDDLSSLSFEIKATGLKVTSDGCTGEEISSRVERHTFDGKLTGTGEITTETSDVDIELPDGTFVPGTQTVSSRSADGRLQVDRLRAVMTDGSIAHVVTTANP
jgi:hypothetical protein